MRFKNIFLFILLFMISCESLELKKKPVNTQGLEAIKSIGSAYISDEQTDLFTKAEWYYYDRPNNHAVKPLFNIYYLKTEQNIFMMQVRDYYASDGVTPGFYEVKFRDKSGSVNETMVINALGCERPEINPDYDECILDPNKDAFTYVNLADFSQFKVADSIAIGATNWHIGFKGPDIKINSGLDGPLNVRAALVESMDFYYTNGEINRESLYRSELAIKGEQRFDDHTYSENAAFYLPRGITRVMHESFWLNESESGELSLINDRWWILKSYQSNSFIKLKVSELLTDKLNSGNTQTTMKIKFYIQKNDEDQFSSEVKEMILVFNSNERRKRLCIDFLSEKQFTCNSANPNWDMSIFNSNRTRGGVLKRRFNIGIQKEGIGPISSDESLLIDSGRGL